MSQFPTDSAARQTPAKTIPMAIYLCHLAFFITGFGPLVGLFLAYANRGQGPDWLETHYRYQIRTFWIGLFYGLIGCLTFFFLVGWLVWLAAAIWLILRCSKGLTALDRNQPIPDPTTWGI